MMTVGLAWLVAAAVFLEACHRASALDWSS
jgi:hypothetical protein